MADRLRRLLHNAEGPFFVDATCIDCDTCRWMAPETFGRRAEQASVVRQPVGEEELRRAMMALVSCPTASIGTESRTDARAGVAALPDPIAPGVFHCGYHSEQSFGAASYVVIRPEGNILVDSPRFAGPLVRKLEQMGGVRWMFLTHQDDVADHARFRERFGCERILHEADVTPGTRDVERRVAGLDPVSLARDVVLIPVPGHTAGSMCLLWKETFLFTGDHLAFSTRLGHVYAFRTACWYDWDELVASTERLSRFSFEWILPGHGRRCHFDRAGMRDQMGRALAWMRTAG